MLDKWLFHLSAPLFLSLAIAASDVIPKPAGLCRIAYGKAAFYKPDTAQRLHIAELHFQV